MNMVLPGFRLMPLTIAAMAAVLAVKTVDLARYAAIPLRAGAAAGMVPEARAALPDKPPGASPAPSATPAEAPALPSGATDRPVSSDERAILLDLRQRRQELDARDAALSVRESILAAAEQKLEARAEQLTALQKELQALEAARKQREEAGWQGLVTLYQDMKPRDAATIFNDLQMPVLLALIDRMNERRAAPILAAMNPDKARDITAGLAKLRTRRESTGATAQSGG